MPINQYKQEAVDSNTTQTTNNSPLSAPPTAHEINRHYEIAELQNENARLNRRINRLEGQVQALEAIIRSRG
jgi:hypothetical protein